MKYHFFLSDQKYAIRIAVTSAVYQECVSCSVTSNVRIENQIQRDIFQNIYYCRKQGYFNDSALAPSPVGCNSLSFIDCEFVSFISEFGALCRIWKNSQKLTIVRLIRR